MNQIILGTVLFAYSFVISYEWFIQKRKTIK